jgi:Protein of unknown function (DUF3105)
MGLGPGLMPAAVHPGEDVPMRGRRVAVPLLVVGIVALLLGACGDDGDGETGTGEDSTSRDESSTSTTAPEIGVVKTYDDLSQEHVAVGETVDYPQIPPVGGTHWEAWQDCGVYDEPIRSEAAVHSMEHGAVWITYRPDLPADQVDLIRAYADQPYVLVSPWEDDSLPAPIVFTAWGAQLMLEALPDPAADEFVTTYEQGATTPEPGAPCTGGIALTAAEIAEELG